MQFNLIVGLYNLESGFFRGGRRGSCFRRKSLISLNRTRVRFPPPPPIVRRQSHLDSERLSRRDRLRFQSRSLFRPGRTTRRRRDRHTDCTGCDRFQCLGRCSPSAGTAPTGSVFACLPADMPWREWLARNHSPTSASSMRSTVMADAIAGPRGPNSGACRRQRANCSAMIAQTAVATGTPQPQRKRPLAWLLFCLRHL